MNYFESVEGVHNKMANKNAEYIQDPKMDWTEDAGLHQWFKDWREDAELLLDMVLSHIRNQETKLWFSVYVLQKKQGHISTWWMKTEKTV